MDNHKDSERERERERERESSTTSQKITSVRQKTIGLLFSLTMPENPDSLIYYMPGWRRLDADP